MKQVKNRLQQPSAVLLIRNDNKKEVIVPVISTKNITPEKLTANILKVQKGVSITNQHPGIGVSHILMRYAQYCTTLDFLHLRVVKGDSSKVIKSPPVLTISETDLMANKTERGITFVYAAGGAFVIEQEIELAGNKELLINVPASTHFELRIFEAEKQWVFENTVGNNNIYAVEKKHGIYKHLVPVEENVNGDAILKTLFELAKEGTSCIITKQAPVGFELIHIDNEPKEDDGIPNLNERNFDIGELNIPFDNGN